MQMEIFMKVIGLMTRLLDLELTLTKLETPTRDFGKETSRRD
jgi:hypothetical protein